MNECFGALLKW